MNAIFQSSNLRKRAVQAAGVLALCGAAAWAGVALAGGTPQQSPLVWGGTLTDDAGKPYPKAVTVSVAFFDSATGTTPKCVGPTAKTDAKTGRFSITLPSACVAAVHKASDLWSETTADGKTLPRVHVGAVPYALEAKVASGATGALATQLYGLSKDVAVLQAAAGGTKSKGALTVEVSDGNGSVLGAFSVGGVGFYGVISGFNIITKKGFLYTTQVAKPIATALYFAQTNCQGPAYAGTGNGATVITRRKLFPQTQNGQITWHRPVGKTDGWSSAGPLKLSSKSRWVETTQACANTSSSAVSAVELTPISAADAGLPTTIAYPLTFKTL